MVTIMHTLADIVTPKPTALIPVVRAIASNLLALLQLTVVCYIDLYRSAHLDGAVASLIHMLT